MLLPTFTKHAAATSGWYMVKWPHDPTIAHLIFTNYLAIPTSEQVAAAIERAHQRGFRAVRTSALRPDAAAVVMAHGFTEIDRLALFEHHLTTPDPWWRDTTDTSHAVSLRPIRRWHHQRLAELDRAAFGPLWGNDTLGFSRIANATNKSHSRLARDGRHPIGFCISGIAGGRGYVQRLAVQSNRRQQGIARQLVADALRWCDAQHCATVSVNTSWSNPIAMLMYTSLGFEQQTEHLTVAECRFLG